MLTKVSDDELTTLTKVVEEESTMPTKVSNVEEGELECQIVSQIKKVEPSHIPIQVDINSIIIIQVTSERCRATGEHKNRLMAQKGWVTTISKSIRVNWDGYRN